MADKEQLSLVYRQHIDSLALNEEYNRYQNGVTKVLGGFASILCIGASLLLAAITQEPLLACSCISAAIPMYLTEKALGKREQEKAVVYKELEYITERMKKVR